jgi:WD40 repeat protein
MLAAATEDGLRAWELVVRPVGVGEPTIVARELFADPGHARNLQFHPSGKWLGFQGTVRRDGQDLGGSFVRGLDPQLGPELADRHSYAVQTLGFVGDGQTLLNMDPDRILHFWDLQSRRSVRTLRTLAAGEFTSTYVGNLRVSPDGSKVAVANHNGLGVNIYDLASGRRLYSLPEEPGPVWWFAWHPDGRHLAVARSNGDISLWNLSAVEAVLAAAGLAP